MAISLVTTSATATAAVIARSTHAVISSTASLSRYPRLIATVATYAATHGAATPSPAIAKSAKPATMIHYSDS